MNACNNCFLKWYESDLDGGICQEFFIWSLWWEVVVSQELGKSLKQSTKDMVAVTSSGNNSQ
ncbi:hypothetical protein CK203_055034 [Vitis vinifera]|uniref:Uncharacterized protein n=1 Tax=Vitis vinifera TaxID=29760 RepID=A0A438GIG5_VITVI|nr:hypothetical protein CK203_055034 [Vitis vinifera]